MVEHLKEADKMQNRQKVIVLCGSTRFIQQMAVCAWLLEKNEGAIVLSLHLLPSWYCDEHISDHLAEHEGVANAMDALHLEKIDMAWRLDALGTYEAQVFVVNVNHYIGESTTRELAHAKKRGVMLRQYTDDPVGASVDKLMKAALERGNQ